VVALLTLILAVLLSSPDAKSSTIREWSRQQPVGFLKTVVYELGGSSGTAEYGPPYNHASEGQHAAFFSPQKWAGVSHPIDTAKDLVIDPLRANAGPELQAEISVYARVPLSSKEDALNNAEATLLGYQAGSRQRLSPLDSDGSLAVWPGEYKDLNQILAALLPLAQSGGLERSLLESHGRHSSDFTKPLLLMADGGWLQRRAKAEHLPSRQWAMMNETGSYPGLPWLWPYALLYQIEPFKSSANADLLVWLVMAALALAFVCVPLIARLRPRSIPRPSVAGGRWPRPLPFR
jgi:hypothetical protein